MALFCKRNYIICKSLKYLLSYYRGGENSNILHEKSGGLWSNHTQGGAHTRRSAATAGVMLRQGRQGRRCTQRGMHTKGGVHTRRSVATAAVMFLKGPQVRLYTQKAVHTQGGAHKRRSVATAGVMLFKGPEARWYTPRVVHPQGGAHKRRPVATAGVSLFWGVPGAAPPRRAKQAKARGRRFWGVR